VSDRVAAHWWARLALLAAVAAVAVPLVSAGIRGGVAIVLLGLAGAAVALAAGWWFLTHRGLVRWLAAAVAVAAPVAVAVAYVWRGLLAEILVSLVLLAGALAAGRRALTTPVDGPREYATPPPVRPFLIMNPRSGGGKVERFDLVARARALGAEVALLEGPGPVDVAALARRAIRDGADLIGVAGGDGTQALVAGIAAEHDIPFLVISAGTRNHFALDLGLDRENPAACLDALADGVEVRVDLGEIGDRTFVNNASFGAYAAVVQSPAYRDDKTRTTLELLPDLLTNRSGPPLCLRVDELEVAGAQAILVSNNPYAADDVAGLGRRPRVDTGRLGVLAVTVRGTSDAVGLLRGRRSGAVTAVAAAEARVESGMPTIPVGIDGEAVVVPAPVTCRIRPGALRVRVPRHRPGARPARPAVDWTRLGALAFSTFRTGPVP
jgi:diacylglycerol kinase family enzyme